MGEGVRGVAAAVAAPDGPAVRRREVVLLAALAPLGCAVPPAASWEARLAGDTVAVLGEVHDNAELHRLRFNALSRAVTRGWRPAIAMEQLDRERQADIERARRERPGDAQHVIDVAVGPAGRSGWNWDFYRPVIALALSRDLPLVAANLSNADATRIVRGGLDAVFDAPARRALRLDEPVAPEWLAAQEHEIDVGHCGALPRTLWPAMARAQLARDAAMAAALHEHAAHGVVLLAGNGHARRDLGVPRWLDASLAPRSLVVGFLEEGGGEPPSTVFDAVVRAPASVREDPCAAFESKGTVPPGP
jgi:uncharacterized iron-regulated protein